GVYDSVAGSPLGRLRMRRICGHLARPFPVPQPRVVRRPDGSTERVKTDRHGLGHRYRVRYVGPDGKERSRSFPDRAKRNAEAFMVSVESDKLRGSYIDPAAGRILFRDYAETWLRTRTFDESSREAAEYKVRKHLYPYFGDRQLGSIKPGDVREWDR